MVLVSLGTQKQQFTRIIELVENADVIKNEEIVVQAGNTKYESKKSKILDFISADEFNSLMEKCDLVICHGGVGTIFQALKQEKKVIAVPRLKKYKEHVNDHQLEICEMLESMGYICYYKEGEDFNNLIKKTMEIDFKKYVSDDSFIDILRKEI